MSTCCHIKCHEKLYDYEIIIEISKIPKKKYLHVFNNEERREDSMDKKSIYQ